MGWFEAIVAFLCIFLMVLHTNKRKYMKYSLHYMLVVADWDVSRHIILCLETSKLAYGTGEYMTLYLELVGPFQPYIIKTQNKTGCGLHRLWTGRDSSSSSLLVPALSTCMGSSAAVVWFNFLEAIRTHEVQ